MLPAPPSISNQAGQIQAVLDGWAAPKGGSAQVASNLTDKWLQSYQSSQKPLILITYTGEQSRGDFSVANRNHRVDRSWSVLIKRGRGFSANRGDSLNKTVGSIEPFYDSVEAIRELLRCMVGISEEIPIDYKSIRPIGQSGGEIIDSYVIEFSTANDIPAIMAINPNQPTN